MNAPDKAQAEAELVTPVYEAYARLVKMLVPSSGCLAIYAVDGDLAWCSDGLERPDFRTLVEGFSARKQGPDSNEAVIRTTNEGVNTLIAELADGDGKALGYVLVDLGQTQTNAGRSMATSMTRPLLRCLASQLALERPASVAEDKKAPPVEDPRLNFLLGIGEIDLNGPRAIGELLRRCVDRLNALSAVFCIPDQDLTEVAERATDDATRAQLDTTRKHLLAWVQLNNRPMVVNRVDADKAPYKILSCPVVNGASKPVGLIALFRGADSINFELDDVRVIEFLARQAMALVSERQDSASGLMNRPAFERLLDEEISVNRNRAAGTLIYFDINDLKSINADFGFPVGDEAILRTAQLIRRSMSPGEFGCRLTGDRFAVYLPERDRENAETYGQELVRSAEALGYASDGKRLPISLRFGAAEASPEFVGSRHWIAAAELACQQARRNRAANPYNAAQE